MSGAILISTIVVNCLWVLNKCLLLLFYNQEFNWWFMTKNAVAVIEIIAREAKCPTEKVTLNTRLDALGIDSLKAIVILSELEDILGIDIPNEIIGSIYTVGDIVAKVDELQTNRKAG